MKILKLGSARGAVSLDVVMSESEEAVWMLLCVRGKQTFL